MNDTQSDVHGAVPPPPEDPIAQREWAKAWQGRLPKGGFKEESKRVDVVNWAIGNAELFRTSSQQVWGQEMRLFINIKYQRDHSTPHRWLGVKGDWVREWRAIRDQEEKDSGKIPRSGDYPEAMDQWPHTFSPPP
jgi:hypothetical protein